MPTTLSVSSTHRVVFHPHPNGPSERLIVTFAPRTDNLADIGFGTQVALDQGHDTIYVGSHRDRYHQDISLEELAPCVLNVAAGREIIAYGASVGAYAALYFGGVLNAKILALSPRNSLHPLCSSIQGQLNHVERLTDIPVSTHRPVVYFDPKQPKDSRLANEWVRPAYPQADFRPIFGVGHNLIGALAKSRKLKPIATSFFNGQVPPDVQIWDKTSPNWYAAESYKAREQGDLEAALAYLLEGAKIAPTIPTLDGIVKLAKLLGKAEVMQTAAYDLRQIKNKRRESKRALANKIGN